jgi:Ca-activated chloride channel homolog
MTDELDALKAALKAGPAPDPQARADAIALAMKNFDGLQGSSDPLRPNSDRPAEAGIWNRIGQMMKGLTTKQALAGTASVAALCIGIVIVGKGPDLTRTGGTVTEVAIPDVKPPVEVMPKPDAVAVEELAQADPVLVPDPVVEPAPPVDDFAANEPEAKVTADEGQAGQGQPAITGLTGTETDSRNRTEAADMATSGDALAQAEAPPPAPVGSVMRSASPLSENAPLQDGVVGYLAGEPASIAPVEPDTEAFSNEAPNPVKVTAEEPVSTFSIDVDTASYAVVRNSLNSGTLPPAEAVRVEEMVNYFPHAYPAPTAEDGPFKPTVTVMPTPWNPNTRLVHIGIQGAMPATGDRPPLNLVFLVDTSGSMDEPNKLPLLKQSFTLLLSQLRPEDQVAIVAYAGSAGTVLEPTAAKDKGVILAALDNLAAGGSTAGAEGLELAYQVAAGMGGDGEVSRILLATDGDFNVGVDDPEGLEAYVAKKRKTGIYLSVLGFGRGNLDDAIMQSLAQNGNGMAAYIDTLNEARKVLVDQLTGALFPIADDVKIQVEWNPAAVAEYRLIGYETRALQREDFNNDRIDAGEIGAGISVTAIYEVTAPGSPGLMTSPLRYGQASASGDAAATAGDASELGFLRLRYKEPGASQSILKETPIGQDTGAASEDAKFAVAIAGFGQLLTGATYLGDWGWEDAIAAALAARGDDPFGYRIEAVNLMRMAQTLSAQ